MNIQSNAYLEVEVKFFIEDIDLIRNRILALNCKSKGKYFEKNIRFDDNNHTLFKNKSLLRLRQDKNNYLTFKSAPQVQDNDVKIMTEYEVQVSDFNSAQMILKSLGFVPVQEYEKWRETFVLESTQILIDTLPYGNFIEIEGEKSKIIALANALGLNWNHRILLNYLSMFELIKKMHTLRFNDVTFDNFSSVHMDISDVLYLFYPDQES